MQQRCNWQQRPSYKAADGRNLDLIGKVVSQPDKDGYVTVFINLK